ncbi:C2H2 type zinc-finger-domain-containing protein [Fennellomyces sp. T-0311]|nr:C2H2 type zinc-finger-domain-containing protein [Fennellomyces sp. T-0311]
MAAALSTPVTLMSTRNPGFTCIACRIVFPTSERQRNHCRTDWHKYNLKRKIADLPPVNAEQFAQKVLAQQAQNREAEEREGLIYECATCRKSYLSENAYHNHMQSKKHREMEVKSEILGMHRHHQPTRRQQLAPLFSDQSDQSDLEDEPVIAKFDPLRLCLFCLFPSNDFDGNIAHMTTVHGFFLPDVEYLCNSKGLVAYLADKIQHEHLCLYCNGRGKEWRSAQAARAHMLDKGHCKMAYDDTEDPEDLLNYYDFEPLQERTSAVPTEDELVLENGTRLGHRQNVRFFKQRLRKHVTTFY